MANGRSNVAGDTVAVRAAGSSVLLQHDGSDDRPRDNDRRRRRRDRDRAHSRATGAGRRHGQPLPLRAVRVPRRAADTMQVTLDSLTMQAYLYGISEVPASWPTEAHNAQAIAARTYAAMRLANAAELHVDLVFDHVQDQYYTGYEKESSAQSDRWVAAVNATDQQIVIHNGAPISAFYFSSSGGATENSEYVFVALAALSRGRP